MKNETNLQIAICNYLKLQYPNVIFFSEPSGLRVSIGQAVQLKKMRSIGKLPDLFIAEPGKSLSGEKWHGLFIEIKAENIFKQDGSLKKNEHLEAQNKMLILLNQKGYRAFFGVGFDSCKQIIDDYLKPPL
jgi:hypothetical protein